jgi:hypothetical protein
VGLITGQNSGVFFDGDVPGPHGFLWGFIALEYYALILNRVRMLLVTSTEFIAINAGGPIAAPSVLSDAWYEPFAYLDDRKVRAYENITAQSDDLLRVSRTNWKCSLTELSSVSFDTKSKWGMGSVPYSGRVFITVKGTERELILLGNQDGKEIERALKTGQAPNTPLQPIAEKRGG